MSTSTMGNRALAPGDRVALRHLEETINEGVGALVRAGNSLRVIRDGELYRETHESFAEYCREHWGMAPDYAHELICSSGVNECFERGATR
jgi:hypothetical protein